MKKYLVIGNPINHSLSPKLHNYWIKKNNINAVYEKKKVNEKNLESIICQIKNKNIQGINVTVPLKNVIIPYLDLLSPEANATQSVNTVYLNGDKVVGHNTDIAGFELSLKKIKYDVNNKKVLILGSGGVVPSIIFALYKMKVSLITICNRTREKAENLRNLHKNLKIVNWGEIPDFDIIVNATSLGLNPEDKIKIDLTNISENKLFYDVIYNPEETNFLKTGKELGHKTENGKMMFIYQAMVAFNLWHGIKPEINEEIIKLLDQ